MIPFFLNLLINVICFPEVKIKANNLMSPWITKRPKENKNYPRSFFKKEFRKMRNSTKNIKKLFEKSRKTLRNCIIKIS